MASIDNENEDSWLYDNDVLKDTLDNSTDNNQTERDELDKLEAMEDSDEKGINGVKADVNDVNVGEGADIQENDFTDGEDITNNHQNDDDDTNNKSDYDDSGDDDVQVTLRDIKEIYDKYPGPPGAIAPGAPISLPVANSAKPPSKGVDVDAVGNVKGVQIYEYDLNSIKIDEKPWRKPGADITDYFNYGFTEDTWMKYCEKQRRLRLENNCRSGLIVGNGQIAGDSANDLDATYLGMNRRQSSQRMTGIGQGAGGTPKQSGVIDVIGGTQRDSRRPQQEFTEVPTSQSPATSVATVMPISMSIPPPMLNMPPPDFAIPPPSSLPPGALGHPVIGPPGIIGHPPILVAPPPNFAPPPLAGQFDPFFRPPMIGGPPPTAVNHSAERRGVPGFPDRPPFRMESIFGAPPAFQGPTGMPPPHWDSRKVPLHSEDRPPQWGRSGSRSRESEISSSSTEETGRKSREKYETSERKSPAYSRGDSRHRSRDRSRRREYDRERSTHERDRRRDYEMSRSSRHHSRHRGYRDEERSSRHYSSRSSRREKSPHDEYRSGSRYSSRKHRHERSRSSSSSSEKERRKSSSSPDHKK